VTATGPKVLLVDDSDLTLEMVAESLREVGFEVRTANGFDAFRATLDAWVPDVIVADVNMPGTQGGPLCKYVKRRAETAHVPVVLVSSLPEPVLAEIAERAGADKFLSKRHGLRHIQAGLQELCTEIVW
jgi:CheY-like chemotaxis protein